MGLRIACGWMIVCLVSLYFVGCGKKANIPQVFIIGKDSLSIEQIRMLDPEGSDDSIKVRNVGLRVLWSEAGGDNGGDDTLVTMFLDRLQLLSNSEWNSTGASLLLKAAYGVAAIHDSTQWCSAVGQKADSLCTKLSAAVPAPFTVSCNNTRWCDTVTRTERETHVVLLQTLFGTSYDVAGLCYEFVFKSQPPPLSGTGVTSQALIAGLVASPSDSIIAMDPSKRPVSGNRIMQPGASAIPKKTAVNVLRFRDEKSIRDSIEQHIPNLRQLYKKILKNDATMSGKVVVSFQVATDGTTIEANVKSTSISDRRFLDPFLSYLRTIRFKPVPENAGLMLFDFPFEFDTGM